MSRPWHWLAAAVFSIIPVVASLAGEIRVYDLRHQLADNLLPVVRQQLADGESAQAFNNQLVVNASPTRHTQIAGLLASLDVPMRNLMITVRRNNDGGGTTQGISASGGIRTGEVYLGTGRPPVHERDDSGLAIHHEGLQVRTRRDIQQQGSSGEQQVRAIEGQPAWIATGQTIAYTARDRWGNPVTEFQDANQGFYVTARVVGDRVQLSISASNDRLSEEPEERRMGIIRTEGLDTTVSGQVGEWIALGGLFLQDSQHSRSTTGRLRESSQQVGDIQVKVIPLD